uniref:Uncharacterized protein n=1 Tax=Quercus lobata TaxID=97700 RepID=A0A7N2M8B3_QUELO
MHDLLQQMGREIVQQKSEELGKRSKIGEFLGIFPNKGCKGTRSRISMDPQTSSIKILDEVRRYRSPFHDRGSKPEDDYFIIRLPGTEIPTWLNLNHESDGNVISFWIGHTFPNIFYVCFAFGPAKYPWMSSCYVYLSINGYKKEFLSSTPTYEFSDHLWIFSLSNNELQYQLIQVLGIVVALPRSLFYPLLVVALIWINGLSIMEEILDIGQEETIDHSILDIPKNTTYPTSDGFESNFVSVNEAFVQSEFQLQRSSPGSRSFNNGEEDSGLSMAHTFVNDCSNSKLCPPSK